MDSGPAEPTVYSVARTVMVPSGSVLPSGSTITALLPDGNRRVAWR